MDVSVGHSHGHYFLTIPTSVHNCAPTREPFVLSVYVVGFESEAWGIDTMGAPLQPGQTFTRAALPGYTLELGGTYTLVGTVTIGGATTTLTQTVTVPTTILGA
jgi:hypothetical protein